MYQELRKIIEKHDSIVLFGHIYPDGDCYGSQIGLRDLLRLNYPKKKVYATGTGLHRFFNLISPMDVVEDEVIKESLAILLDGNDLSRMEDQRIYSAKAFIKIDHHIENFKFSEGKFVIDTNANSTCEMVVRMAQESGWKINPTIANALFLGMLTDSGRFQYIEDFPQAFHEAAWLCKNGANPKALDKIINVSSESSLAFKGYVYTHFKKTDNGVIYLTFPYSKLQELHVSPNKAGSMVNLIGNVIGYPIWAFFCEFEDGTCHAEFRSNGADVHKVAAKYGGGGHLLASGVTLPQLNDEIVKQIISDLNDVLVEYKKEKN